MTIFFELCIYSKKTKKTLENGNLFIYVFYTLDSIPYNASLHGIEYIFKRKGQISRYFIHFYTEN